MGVDIFFFPFPLPGDTNEFHHFSFNIHPFNDISPLIIERNPIYLPQLLSNFDFSPSIMKPSIQTT
jgi:hypothetical protein